MSKDESTDHAKTARDVNVALGLVARSVLECAALAGSMRGPLGAALAPVLSRAAVEGVAELERLASALALLGARPTVNAARLTFAAGSAERSLDRLMANEEQTIQALVEAIPADADDVPGEALEHILEHAVMRRADVIAALRRAGS